MDNTLAGMGSRRLVCITLTNWCSDSMRTVVATSSLIVGAVILIAIVIPWFLIGIVFIFIIYAYAAAFYRASARELKVRFFFVLNCFNSYDLPCSFSDLVSFPPHKSIFPTNLILRCYTEVLVILPLFGKFIGIVHHPCIRGDGALSTRQRETSRR